MAGGNWKNAGGDKPPAGGGGGGAAGGGKSRRPWQPGDPHKKPTAGKKKSRLGRIIFVGGITGVLLALFVWLVLWPDPPKYPSVIVVGPNPGGTSLAVPENAAGANAAAAFAEWADDPT